jgi:signal transduction histidine kinase
MIDKPTYQELENQIAELQNQNKILHLDFSLQSLERDKRASELKIANIELQHQNGEKKKRAAELKIANVELKHQSREKEKRAAELMIANIELEYQSKEKGKRAAELVIANIELEYQSKEKVKRADELKMATIELKHQSSEKKKRAAELIIANIELVFQKEEKAKRAAELIISKVRFAQQSEENEKLEEELLIANLAVALQSELTLAKEKAEENEVLLSALNATKDKLFSIIAHDLRSPFNSITGLSELLNYSADDKDFEEVKSLAAMILTSSNGGLILLDNLLNWAKSQTGQINFKPETLELKPIIEELFELLKPTAQLKHISLNYNPTIAADVYADENMLKTVLRNLISNAIKFTETSGKIDIFTKNVADRIETTVSDNGVGMNEKALDQLFKLGVNVATSGTANEKGSGLGLLLCKEFIDRHGGRIWVESDPEKGSAFTFSLPVR